MRAALRAPGTGGRGINVKRIAVILVAVIGVLADAAVAPAQGVPDAVLYELTENMKLKTLQAGVSGRRQATSQLMGRAEAGTFLCPLPVPCVVNATGSDDISLETGLGKFKGTFTTVVQGDNPYDAPEFVVLRGTFTGVMDFSPAILHGVPYGTVVGQLRTERGERRGFTGTFLLPFGFPGDPSNTTYYLAGPSVVPVEDWERALGYATVKFEIRLQ